jgi:hypothetical protein
MRFMRKASGELESLENLRAEYLDGIALGADLMRHARGDGTRPSGVVEEERWHALADALDALGGLLGMDAGVRRRGDTCRHCPPAGLSLDTEAAGGVYRCGYCGKRWRGKALGTGSMWHEVPE